MALETITNIDNPAKSSGKKSKKKESTPSTTAPPAPTEAATPALTANDTSVRAVSVDGGSHESTYIKDLQKNIRNVTKKLTAMQKVDSVIAENPGVSLDDLVASRKINNDQKAQALKKPALKAQLVQFEEQIAQYKKFEEEYQTQAAKEKEQLLATHQEELEALRSTAKQEATAEAERDTRQKLLTLSRFLRAAASRRQVEDDTSEESKAFEGLLLMLYGGDNAAVDAAEKLIAGSDEGVTSTDDVPLTVSYSKIKEISEAYAPFAAEEAWRQEVADAEQNHSIDASTEPAVSLETDPTLAHAGLTELNATSGVEHATVASTREPGDIDQGAANEAAASNWDTTGSAGQDTMVDSWVSVSAPRDPAETETAAVDAPTEATPNWADDTPDVSQAAATAPGDGFHEVHHNRSGGRGRGGSGHERGGRGRGGHRGDGNGHRGRGGFRGERSGEFRGRGRGGRGARGTAA